MFLRLSWLAAILAFSACDPVTVVSQGAPEFESAWAEAGTSPALVTGTYGPTGDTVGIDVVEVHAEEGWVQIQSGADVWAYALDSDTLQVVYPSCAEPLGMQRPLLTVVDEPQHPLASLLNDGREVHLAVDPCVSGAINIQIGDDSIEMSLL